MVFEIIQIIIFPFVVVFKTLISLFPIYQQLSGLKEQIIAAAIGVPTIAISIISIIKSIVRFFIRNA